MTSFDDSAFKRQMSNLSNINKEIAQPIYKFFKEKTPKRTGNARNQTALTVTKDQITIDANYPYATELDSGKSPKAPKGMTKPTEQEVQRVVNNFIRKIG